MPPIPPDRRQTLDGAEALPDTMLLPASPARLVAVRKAGACFEGPLNVRSPQYEVLLEEHTRLRQALDAAKTQLVETLYAAVAGCLDTERRRLLIRAKRAVFNERPVAALLAEPCLHAERDTLDHYARLRARCHDLFDASAEAVFADLFERLDALVHDPAFFAACRYSSPELAQELAKATASRSGLAFTKLDRSLYAYAAKGFSKANPFHTFAAIAFAPALGIAPPAACEVLLNLDTLYTLESRLLEHNRAHPPVPPLDPWVYLKSGFREAGKVTFLLMVAGQYRLVSVEENAILRALLGFFDQREAPCRQSACLAFVAEHLPHLDRRTLDAYLQRLIRAGILVEYLIRDADAFGPDLHAAARVLGDEAGGFADAVEALQEVHQAPLSLDAVPDLRERFDRIGAQTLGGTPIDYFVNRYAPGEPMQAHEDAAQTVFDDLRALKPLFAETCNFSEHEQAFRGIMADFFAGQPGAAVPYLRLLYHFLRHQEALWAAHYPDRSEEGRPSERAALEGRLLPADLTALALHLPHDAAARSICFNGPFDYQQGVFYLTNIWDGQGRFTHRYLINQPRAPQRDASEPDVLAVQLVLPAFRNKNYVARLFPTGCSFDERHRHTFARWIRPADITVAWDDGEVTYRHGETGRRLRFHHLGSALATYLPWEYQLLLLGHADFFVNVFSRYSPPGGDFVFKPGLRYGAVCLRRDRWLVRGHRLPAQGQHENLLAYTTRFRAWIHEHLKPGVEHWYYRLDGGRTGAFDPYRHKPFFLDVRNPLSVFRFLREAAGLSRDSVVAFEPMEPPIEHLHRDHEGPFLTELMIEV